MMAKGGDSVEYCGQKRSNFLMAGIVWFFFSLYILLKAVPYQLPLKPITIISFLRLSLCYFIFVCGVLIIACMTRDKRLLCAYAAYAVVVLLVLMVRETEIERELVDKLRNYLVGFLVMPYWGWSRMLEEATEQWVAAWCAISGAVAFFASRLSEAE